MLHLLNHRRNRVGNLVLTEGLLIQWLPMLIEGRWFLLIPPRPSAVPLNHLLSVLESSPTGFPQVDWGGRKKYMAPVVKRPQGSLQHKINIITTQIKELGTIYGMLILVQNDYVGPQRWHWPNVGRLDTQLFQSEKDPSCFFTWNMHVERVGRHLATFTWPPIWHCQWHICTALILPSQPTPLDLPVGSNDATSQRSCESCCPTHHATSHWL